MTDCVVCRKVLCLTLLLALGFVWTAECDGDAQADDALAALALDEFLVTHSADPLGNGATRLASHLGIKVGGVDVAYAGPRSTFLVGVEVWHDGQVVEPINWTRSWSHMPPTKRELTFSSRRVEGEDDKFEFGIVSPGVVTRPRFSSPPLSLDTQSVKYFPGEAVFDDTDRPAVFAFVAGAGTESVRGDESVEEIARRVEYAVVFRVGFQVQRP